MKHPSEEDLFMLAHRSIGLGKAASIWFHMRGCEGCRARYAEGATMVSAVAGAVRGSRQPWRPFDRTLRTQALLAVLLLGISGYAIQRAVIAEPAPESWHNAAEGACLTPEETSSPAKIKPAKALKETPSPSKPTQAR